MLAKRIPVILPPFTFKEALEITKIHPVSRTIADLEGGGRRTTSPLVRSDSSQKFGSGKLGG